MRRRIDAHVVMEKIIPRITKEYRKLYPGADMEERLQQLFPERKLRM